MHTLQVCLGKPTTVFTQCHTLGMGGGLDQVPIRPQVSEHYPPQKAKPLRCEI